MSQQEKDQRYKGPILLALVLACIVLTIVVNLFAHNQTVYTQFFYVPILLAAIWYHEKAWILAAFLGVLHIAANFADAGYIDPSTLLRAITFLFVALMAGWLAGQKDALNERLKQSNVELSNIIEFYPDATLIIDNGGKVMAWNHAMETMTGVRSGDMIGKGNLEYSVPFYGLRVPLLIDLIDVPEAEIKKKYSEVTVAGGRIEAMATGARIKGNDVPVLLCCASRLYDAGGQAIGAIESVRDVTAQKQMEIDLGKKLKELEFQHDEMAQQDEELEKQNEELLRVFNRLKVSEEQYRIIAESIDDGIVAMDLQYNVTFFNRRAEEITGFKKDDVMGKNVYSMLGEVHRTRFDEAYGQIGKGITLPAFEIVITRKDERRVPVEVNASPLHDSAGKPVGVIVAFRDITLRRDAETLLKRYQLLSRYANDIIIFIGPDGRIIEANDAALLTYGYRRDELLNMRIHDLRAGAPPELIKKQIEQAEKGGTLFEAVHRCRDGRLIPVEISSRGVNMGGERVLLSIVRDISDRKRIEELQRESEERFRNVADSTLEAIISTDENLCIVFWNRAAERIFGYRAGEVIGKPMTMLIPPEGLTGFMKAKESYTSDETIGILNQVVRYTAVRRDGTRFPIEMSHSSWTQNGRTMFSAVVRDITERRKAEEALQASEARFRSIFEDSAVGIYLVDVEGRLLESNEAFQQMLGYSGDELRALTVKDYTCPADYDAEDQRYKEMLDGMIDSYQIEKRYVRKDGGIMWGRLFKSMVRGPTGKPQYCIALVEDFTERKNSEEALSYKNKELSIISGISAVINRSHSIEETLEGTLSGSLELLDMDAGAIYMSDPSDRSKLTLRAFVPWTEAGFGIDPRKTIRADPSLNTEKVFYHADGGTSMFGEIFDGKTASIIVPVLLKGFAIGLMAFCSERPVSIMPAETADLLSIGSQLGIAIDNHTLMRTLRATSNYMAEIINESPDALLTADARGYIISANKRAARLLQYDMVELSGMNVKQLLPPGADVLVMAGDRSYVREFMRKDSTKITLNISTSHFESGDVAGGFIIALKDLSEIAGLKIVPIVENAIAGARKYHFDKGCLYLMDKGSDRDCMEVFADQVKHNIQGLCITRGNPKKIREKYGLEKTPIVWLNGSDLPTGESCIKPDNLTGLGATIYKFLSEAKDGIVLLDGAEYLVARNSFESVLKFLHLLNDRVMVSNCTVLFCIDPLALETRQFHLLLSEMREFKER
ncbi:MAG: PAS domain S-box protein [Methanocella sp.]